MPILLSVLLGFLLGVAFTWMSRAELGESDAPVITTRPFNVVAGFAALVYGPLVGYFVAFHGDWTYGYLVPWSRVPSAVDLALVLVAGSSVLIGMVVSARAARARHLDVVAWLTGIPLALSVVVLVLGAGRLAVSASYAQYHGAFGVEPVSASALGRGILVMSVVLVLGVAWTVRCLSKEGSARESIPPVRHPFDL
jgi:hypothetical protein